MPELPEVETVRRGLAPLIEGQRISHVQLNRADLRAAFPKDMAKRLAHASIERIDRRAKYLLLRLDNDLVLIVHLGMSGSFFVAPHGREPKTHDHVTMALDNGAELVFNDPRRFGSMDLVAAADLAGYRALKALGPEPLGDEFDGKTLFAVLRPKKTTLKAALMDQRVVAGLGNIYVCEGLFRSHLDPRRLCNTLTSPQATRLAAAIKAVLQEALASGGSSLRDFINATGEGGYFQHHFEVYDQEGKPCSNCGKGVVQRITQAGRSTFFCPKCQR